MFSWVAIDRFAEKERAKSAAFRKQSAGKVLRSDAKQLTDDELLAKLRSFGIELDRPSLERLCREALSAEEIATPLVDQRTFHGRQAEMESDWIWVCLTALWQRWFPAPAFPNPDRAPLVLPCCAQTPRSPARTLPLELCDPGWIY